MLASLFCGSRRVIIVDEFQRLAEAGLPQLLQEAWDLKLSNCTTPSLLLLLGSSMGTIEKVTLSRGPPTGAY